MIESSGLPVLDPPIGSAAEAGAFAWLQAQLPDMYRQIFKDPAAPRTVVVVPSLSLDPRELSKIVGVTHYEERLLCLLMLLRMPRTELIYVTSMPLDPAIVDYYLSLLPGVPSRHARRRLHLMSADDDCAHSLTRKILESPELLARMRARIADPTTAHMTCFNTTPLERSLAVQLGIPMYACDPDLVHLGNKSMGRTLFRDVGLTVADGYEHLRDRQDVIDALGELHANDPLLRRAVVKLNEGFSGEGNAIVSLVGLDDAASPARELERRITCDLRFEAADEEWDAYEEKLGSMGGIVEAMIDAPVKHSPSVQVRIDPIGTIDLVSTHEQVLGGPGGQVFEGCRFPARKTDRDMLHEAGMNVGRALRGSGVIGRFGIDFISVPSEQGTEHYAIEINLRKGGTTLPYLMLEFLTGGSYNPDEGRFVMPGGDTRTYYATDNLVSEPLQGLTPEEVIDLTVLEGLHYDATEQEGVVFHLLGAVTNHGKIGMVSIAGDKERAHRRYEDAVDRLEAAAFRATGPA